MRRFLKEVIIGVVLIIVAILALIATGAGIVELWWFLWA